MTLQTAEMIAFPIGVSRKEFLKTARAGRMSSCTVEPMDGVDAPDEIDCQARKERKARKAAAAADRPVTAINSDLRIERRTAWRAAEAFRDYWRARLDFESAASMPSLCGTPEGRSLYREEKGRYDSVDKWRAALVKQLLTPAPDINSVKWKQVVLASGKLEYTGANPKQIERAIADDIAWLAAHPTKRTGNVEACANRRAFKEAMRQRIREIAASLNLSDIQIKPALKLKHEHIGPFCEAHSVNLGWLLEGIEPMFKAWPTS